MTITKTWEKIKDLALSMEGDINKVESSGTKAAGKRARKTLQEIKKHCQTLRVDLMEEIRG